MDLEKMDNSINEMEEIVSKMRGMKDACELLEKNAEFYKDSIENVDKIQKKLDKQIKEFDSIRKEITDSYDEIYTVNQAMRKDFEVKTSSISTDITNFKTDMKDYIRDLRDQNNSMNKRFKIMFIFLFGVLLLEIINIVLNIIP